MRDVYDCGVLFSDFGALVVESEGRERLRRADRFADRFADRLAVIDWTSV